MAQVTTTSQGGPNAGASIKEDLVNFITTIAREETPFMSSIGNTSATAVSHEWLTDDLEAPADVNVTEGKGYTAADVDFANRVRKANYCAIYRKELGTSGTADAVNTAGTGGGEYAYQLKKNAKEMKRGMERALVRFQGTGAPTETVKAGSGTRRTGSIFTWVKTVLRASAAGTIVPVPSSGTAGTAVTLVDGLGIVPDGDLNGDNIIRPGAALTAVSLTRNHFETILAGMYEQGARPNMAMMSPTLKVKASQVFSDANAGTAAQRRMTAMEKKLNIAVTAVMTDFGFDIALVPNYQFGSGSQSAGFDGILFYDASEIKRAVLRPFQEERYDNFGDGKKGALLCEEALAVYNPKVIGALYGVN